MEEKFARKMNIEDWNWTNITEQKLQKTQDRESQLELPDALALCFSLLDTPTCENKFVAYMTALAHQEPAFARCNATRRLHNLALLKLQPLVIRLKIRRHASLSNGRDPREDKPKAVQPQTRKHARKRAGRTWVHLHDRKKTQTVDRY